MADRQPISAFGLQASNSAKKRQVLTNSRRLESSSRSAHGILRFKQPSAANANSATSPISIEDDVDEDLEPVRETAGSWEQEAYTLAEYGPSGSYDETFKPSERDSQDDTMPTVFRKTRQQPARRAVSKRGPEAFHVEINGQYTPPATNSRLIRGDRTRTTDTKRQHEVDMLHSSDPVETPVAGPSRPRLTSKTPLVARRTLNADGAGILANTSGSKIPPAMESVAPFSAKVGEGEAVRRKNWLSKRSGNDSTSRSNAIQTKLTAFTKDKTLEKNNRTDDLERNRVEFDLSSLPAISSYNQDDEELDESIRFVSMQNKAVGSPSATSAKYAPRARVTNHNSSHAIASTRPQPRRKKRKSDDITGDALENNIDPPIATIAADPRDALSPRLNSHKRFKKQQERRAGGLQDRTACDGDETSSLTSLSKGPSSEAGEEEALVMGAVRVARSRTGRAMKVICSSDAEEMAEDDRLASEAENQKQLSESSSSTISSMVPDSQPWHVLSASLVERARVDSAVPIAIHLNPESDDCDGRSPTKDEAITNGTGLKANDGPDVDLKTYTGTQLGEGTGSLSEVPVRVVGREARPFPFPSEGPQVHQGFGAPLRRGQSSITISSLRHSEPSQGITAISNLAAKTRQAIPSLTEDDSQTAGIHASSTHPSSQQARNHQDNGSSQESESIDFFRHMRKILPPPTGQASRPMRFTAIESRPIVRDDLFSQPQRVQGSTIVVARPLLDDAATDAKESGIVSEKRELQGKPAMAAHTGDTAPGDADPAASVEETMLPLTLDTQLYRPGILSPNFQLRRRKPATKNTFQPEAPGAPADQPTPQTNQAVVSPEAVGSHRPVALLNTPSRSDANKSKHRSPESMVDDVQTLATWSPVRPAMYNPSAVDGPLGVSGTEQEKENLPVMENGGLGEEKQVPDSPDEYIEGTYGPIESLHLLETYHRGYTPRKELVVSEREKAMPRVPLRSRRMPTTTTAFQEVNQAWKGAQNDDATPRPANSQRASRSKEDARAQSKLASYGFLKNENVKTVRPIGFGKEFEDEDDLQDEEQAGTQKTFDRRSWSPTPRKSFAAGKALGAVPPPPIDPRMRPAGIRELQRRDAAASKWGSPSIDPQSRNTDQLDWVSVKHVDVVSDDTVPSSQPSENQQDILNSDSSTDVRWAAGMAEYAAIKKMNA